MNMATITTPTVPAQSPEATLPALASVPFARPFSLFDTTDSSRTSSHPLQAVEVRNVSKVFKKRKGFKRKVVSEKWALKDISFSIGIGETYGLLGPNGSGKSTLIRILSTLLRQDDGSVTMMGHRLPDYARLVQWNIGRVSVDAAFYKKLSPRENLLYAAQLYALDIKKAEQRAMEILERLGIDEDRFREPIEEMSRGMQQKIAITRALLLDPPLLLLDEPTTGLDPKSRRDVQTFLEELRAEQGTTILLTTHDMAEAERLCHRIGFLSKGRLVLEGTASEIKEASGTDNLDDAFIAMAGETLEDDPPAD